MLFRKRKLIVILKVNICYCNIRGYFFLYFSTQLIQHIKQILLSNGNPLRRINLIMARTLKNLKKKNLPKLKTSPSSGACSSGACRHNNFKTRHERPTQRTLSEFLLELPPSQDRCQFP